MSLINNTSWTGKDLTDFFTTALLTGNSASLFKPLLNVKSIAKIPYLNIGNLFQVGNDCGSTASGAVTLSQKSITVCPIDVNLSLCNGDYEDTFLSESMKPGSTYAQTPEGFAAFLMDLMKARISQQSEYMTWQGNTAGSPATVCDGLIKKFLADATVIDVDSPATLSKSNIVGELEKVYNAIPLTLLNQGKDANGTSRVKIFISIAAARYYMEALYATFPAIYATNNGDWTLKFLDIELIVAPGMPTSTMVAAIPGENLIFATDLTDDMMSIEMKLDPTPGSKKTHWVTSFKWAVDYANGVEVVLYGTGS